MRILVYWHLLAVVLLLVPQGNVVLKELKDQGGLGVLVLDELVEEINGLLERSVGKLDSLLLLTNDLVKEDGVVKGETKVSRVGLDQLLLGDGHGVFVGGLSLVGAILPLGISLELDGVTPVVSLELLVEDLGGGIIGGLKELGISKLDEFLAVVVELLDELLLELVELVDALWDSLDGFVLEEGVDSAEGAAAGASEGLVGDREEVALISAQLRILVDDLVHLSQNISVALGLVRNTCHEELQLAIRGHLIEKCLFESHFSCLRTTAKKIYSNLGSFSQFRAMAGEVTTRE